MTNYNSYLFIYYLYINIIKYEYYSLLSEIEESYLLSFQILKNCFEHHDVFQ